MPVCCLWVGMPYLTFLKLFEVLVLSHILYQHFVCREDTKCTIFVQRGCTMHHYFRGRFILHLYLPLKPNFIMVACALQLVKYQCLELNICMCLMLFGSVTMSYSRSWAILEIACNLHYTVYIMLELLRKWCFCLPCITLGF